MLWTTAVMLRGLPRSSRVVQILTRKPQSAVSFAHISHEVVDLACLVRQIISQALFRLSMTIAIGLLHESDDIFVWAGGGALDCRVQ